MAKILLVEDDNNLREIYEARLMAEGYEIVTARDGEEALTVAMKEKPDLVISDVMMPKISGFDMLDILRTTEETKDVKVIMMTALSQAEDKARAEKLGADRYLVKSQVTLEDVAKVAKEVLQGTSGDTPDKPVAAVAATETPEPTPAPAPDPDPVPVPAPEPAEPPAPTTPPVAPVQTPSEPVVVETPPVATAPAPAVEQTAVSEEKAIAEQIEGLMAQSVASAGNSAPASPLPAPTTPAPAPDPDPVPVPAPEPAEPPAPTTPPVAPSTPPTEEPKETQIEVKSAKKVIAPINDVNADMRPKLDELLAKEEESEQMAAVAANVVQQAGSTTPAAAPVKDEAPDAPITPPTPDTKIDPNSIAL